MHIMEEMARYTADPKKARSMAQNSGPTVTSLVAEWWTRNASSPKMENFLESRSRTCLKSSTRLLASRVGMGLPWKLTSQQPTSGIGHLCLTWMIMTN